MSKEAKRDEMVEGEDAWMAANTGSYSAREGRPSSVSWDCLKGEISPKLGRKFKIYGKTHNMKVRSDLISELFEQTHGELELVLGDNERRDFWRTGSEGLSTGRFRFDVTAFWGPPSSTSAGIRRWWNISARTRPLALRDTIILSEPLEVALVHVVGYAIEEIAFDALLERARGFEKCARVGPSSARVVPRPIVNKTGCIRDGNGGLGVVVLVGP